MHNTAQKENFIFYYFQTCNLSNKHFLVLHLNQPSWSLISYFVSQAYPPSFDIFCSVVTLLEKYFLPCHPFILINNQNMPLFFVFALACLLFSFMSKCYFSHFLFLRIQLTQRKHKFHYTRFLILLFGLLMSDLLNQLIQYPSSQVGLLFS